MTSPQAIQNILFFTVKTPPEGSNRMNVYAEVLYVLCIALVEIRATGNIKKANILADVVHNVPMMIANGHDNDKIVAEIRSKASRQGCEPYFDALLDKAQKIKQL